MKQYESYKDSGIEWLGKIPSHWKEEKLKHLVSCNDEVLEEFTDPESIINYVEISDVDSVNGVNQYTQYSFKDAPSRARRITKKGDIIISTVRTYLKAIASIKEDNLIVSTGFAVLRPQKIESAFISYALQNEFFLGEVVSRSTGVSYPAITSTDLVEIKIPVPTATEQRIIASYLDSKVSQIDAVIAEKEKMVEDLQSYRKSIISEAVTRGLNPDVPMKDTGIEWLGIIPEHWELCKVKNHYNMITGFTPNTNNQSYYSDDDSNTWVTIADMKGKVVSSSKNHISAKYIEEFAPQIVRKGSLLYSFKLSVGAVAFAGKDLYTNEAIASFESNENVNLDFLYYSSQYYIIKNANVNIYGAYLLNQDLIRNAVIVFPPLEEQKAIASYLDNKVGQIDVTLKELQSGINELKAFKSSVITEAVTGKVDLR